MPRVRVVSAAESAVGDRAAMAAGVPSRALMRAAGMAAAAEISRRCAPHLAAGVTVYTGPGNNGGDGWVVAGALGAAGVTVRVEVVDESRTDDSRAERDAAQAVLSQSPRVDAPGVVVDGLLGTGATGAPRGPIATAIAAIDAHRSRGACVVALDVPSGLDATTGAAEGAVRADLTLTFGTLKRGLTIARGVAGTVVVLDIGLGSAVDDASRAPTLVDARFVDAIVPSIPADANKGTRRRIAIVAAGEGMAGAAVLASRAALASGIGLVRFFVAPKNLPVVQTAAFESVAHEWPADDEVVHRDIETWADALLLGPGLGQTPEARAVAERVLRVTRLPTVIDADGLNIFAGRTADLATLLAKRPAIITPHPAEFGRLAGRSVEDVLANRFEIAAPLAAQLGATVLLKGVPTVITDPEGKRLVSAAGTPVLAVGGSGDLLSGIVTTLFAQTRDPLGSAGAAAWIHGTAAERAGASRIRGVLLDEVVAALPAVWEARSAPPHYPVLAELPAVGERP